MQIQRQKTNESEYERQAKEFLSLYGIFKGKYPHRTEEEYQKLKREAADEYLAELEKKFSRK